MESLGIKILELRKQNNYSQDELASKIGVTRQAISKWERDEGLPDLYNIKSLAKVFNVSIDELLEHKSDNETIEDKPMNNKLAIILMSIPGFIFLISIPVLSVFTAITTVIMIIELFTPSVLQLDINIQVIALPLALIYSYVSVYLYKSIYTGYKSKESKLVLIVLYALTILGYLLLLTAGEIAGFSLIFLYIVGLLILITGLVGVVMFHTDESYEVSNKINKTFTITKNVLKWFVLVSILMIPLNLAKDALLVREFSYLDQLRITNTDYHDDEYIFLEFVESSDEDGFQVLTNFCFNLEDDNITNPYLQLYIKDTLITEGEFEVYDTFDWEYQYYQDLQTLPLDYILFDKDESGSDLEIVFIVSYDDSEGISKEVNFYINYDLSYNRGIQSVWIWDYKKLFEE